MWPADKFKLNSTLMYYNNLLKDACSIKSKLIELKVLSNTIFQKNVVM